MASGAPSRTSRRGISSRRLAAIPVALAESRALGSSPPENPLTGWWLALYRGRTEKTSADRTRGAGARRNPRLQWEETRMSKITTKRGIAAGLVGLAALVAALALPPSYAVAQGPADLAALNAVARSTTSDWSASQSG